ncbi:Translation elongation factor 1-alpha, partial [Phytophthora palmivora]
MSRHRNVRNRAYSYEDEGKLDMSFSVPNSPNSKEFMYRRDSPSRQRSVFSFVQQEDTAELNNKSVEDPGDTEILEAMIPQVQQAVGSRFSAQQITEELRSANYDLDKTVVALLEKGKAPAAAGGVLPLQIQIPRLEAVALAIGNEVKETKPKKEIVMPAPAKGKAMAIGGAVPSPMRKAEEEKKVPRMSAADATNAAPTITRTQTQFTPAEKKAFERAELKTQEQAAKLEEEARTGGKTKISMVVIGHVDAGKSTITGHLLYKLGYVSKRLMHKYEKESREAGKSSFAYAWVMDADEEERKWTGMIAGAAQADVAVLVVPAVTGEFEAAFENSGQTKEHTLLVRSLGVSQMVVAVNKMDTVNWDKERFDNIVKSL